MVSWVMKMEAILQTPERCHGNTTIVVSVGLPGAGSTVIQCIKEGYHHVAYVAG